MAEKSLTPAVVGKTVEPLVVLWSKRESRADTRSYAHQASAGGKLWNCRCSGGSSDIGTVGPGSQALAQSPGSHQTNPAPSTIRPECPVGTFIWDSGPCRRPLSVQLQSSGLNPPVFPAWALSSNLPPQKALRDPSALQPQAFLPHTSIGPVIWTSISPTV